MGMPLARLFWLPQSRRADASSGSKLARMATARRPSSMAPSKAATATSMTTSEPAAAWCSTSAATASQKATYITSSTAPRSMKRTRRGAARKPGSSQRCSRWPTANGSSTVPANERIASSKDRCTPLVAATKLTSIGVRKIPSSPDRVALKMAAGTLPRAMPTNVTAEAMVEGRAQR